MVCRVKIFVTLQEFAVFEICVIGKISPNAMKVSENI